MSVFNKIKQFLGKGEKITMGKIFSLRNEVKMKMFFNLAQHAGVSKTNLELHCPTCIICKVKTAS